MAQPWPLMFLLLIVLATMTAVHLLLYGLNFPTFSTAEVRVLDVEPPQLQHARGSHIEGFKKSSSSSPAAVAVDAVHHMQLRKTSIFGSSLMHVPALSSKAVLKPRIRSLQFGLPFMSNTTQDLYDSVDSSMGCHIPAVSNSDFSATQVAYLVAELQQSITSPCFTVISTTLAVCLPDLSLVEGCCTPDCSKALHQYLPPQCLLELSLWTCTEMNFFAGAIVGVASRCLGQQYNCTMLKKLNMSVDSIAATIKGSWLPVGPDEQYYRDCLQEPAVRWDPAFNGSQLADLLLVFAADVSHQCLRSAASYLPACYDDLTYKTGCCSLKCRAAIGHVTLDCFQQFWQSLCRNMPGLDPYFTTTGQRCANITVTCESLQDLLLDTGFQATPQTENTGTGAGLPPGASAVITGGTTSGILATPVVATQNGDCAIASSKWPDYNALQVALSTLELVDVKALPDDCNNVLQHLALCAGDLPVLKGCCSYDCALALRKVTPTCLYRMQHLLCRKPEIAKYSLHVGHRCLGTAPTCGKPHDPRPDKMQLIQDLASTAGRLSQSEPATDAASSWNTSSVLPEVSGHPDLLAQLDSDLGQQVQGLRSSTCSRERIPLLGGLSSAQEPVQGGVVHGTADPILQVDCDDSMQQADAAATLAGSENDNASHVQLVAAGGPVMSVLSNGGMQLTFQPEVSGDHNASSRVYRVIQTADGKLEVYEEEETAPARSNASDWVPRPTFLGTIVPLAVVCLLCILQIDNW